VTGDAATDDSVTGPRLAVNPIAYWLAGGAPDRTTRTLGPAFTELAEIGYRAVKADVPDDMDADDYLPWLASFGLEPALSLYSGDFTDPDTHEDQAEAARVCVAVEEDDTRARVEQALRHPRADEAVRARYEKARARSVDSLAPRFSLFQNLSRHKSL